VKEEAGCKVGLFFFAGRQKFTMPWFPVFPQIPLFSAIYPNGATWHGS
jgi:hypothetical protein